MAFPVKANEAKGDYFDPNQFVKDDYSNKRILNENWIITSEILEGSKYPSRRFIVENPKGSLTSVIQFNEQTEWVAEHLIKEKKDIEIIADYITHPLCDVEKVNEVADKYGDSALIRGFMPMFDIYGQPGCWQDTACLFGVETLIL